MFRKTGKLSAALVVAVFTVTLYGCGGGGDDSANSLQDPRERVTELEETIAALEAALAEDQELTPATIEALATAAEALAALHGVMLGGDRMLDSDGLAALVESADALAALQGVMLGEDRMLDSAGLQMLVTAADALAALEGVMLGEGRMLDPAGLEALVESADALAALKAVALGTGRTLDPVGLAALVAAADAFAALDAVTLRPGDVLDAATLGQLVVAAVDLKNLMDVALGGHGPLTVDALGMLVEAADALDRLEGVILLPGQTLDAATLGLLVTAAGALADLEDVSLGDHGPLNAPTLQNLVTMANAYAGLMAVANAQGVELTATTLAAFIEAYEQGQMSTAVDDHFRARAIGVALVRGRGADRGDRLRHAPRIPPRSEASPEKIVSNNARIMTNVMVDSSGSHMVDVDGNPDKDIDTTDENFAGVGATPALSDDTLAYNPPSTHVNNGMDTMWHGRILERGLPGGATDHVVVYSNIRPPWIETFAEAYGDLDTTDDPGKPSLVADPTEAQQEAYDTALRVYHTALATVESDDFMTDKVPPGAGEYVGAMTVEQAAMDAADKVLAAEFLATREDHNRKCWYECAEGAVLGSRHGFECANRGYPIQSI